MLFKNLKKSLRPRNIGILLVVVRYMIILTLMQTLWLRMITLLSNFIPLCACVLSFVKSNIFEDVEYYGIPSSFLFCTVVHFSKIHQIKAR